LGSIRRRNQLHDVGTPGFSDQTLVVDWSFHESDIDVLLERLLGDVAGVGADEMQFDARIGPMECAEISRDQVGRNRRAGADAKRAVVQAPQGRQFFLGRALHREQRLGAPRQRQPFRGGHHAFWRAIEQPAADLKFEVAYPLRDRGLADI
jgi:hypothetical protein